MTMPLRTSAAALLALGLGMLPACGVAFVSGGLTEALVELGTVVDDGGSGSGSSGGVTFTGPGFFPPPPRLWTLTLHGRPGDAAAPPIVLSGDTSPDPAFTLAPVAADGFPDSLGIRFRSGTAGSTSFLDLTISGPGPGEPLATGVRVVSSADEPRLEVAHGPGECRSETRSYEVDTLALIDRAIARLELRFQCGNGFHGAFRYDDTALTGNPSVRVSGNVWEDENGDGVRDGSLTTRPDTALEEVQVNLLLDGQRVASVTSHRDDGSFRFLAPLAAYSVEVVPPPGFTPTLQEAGDDPGRYSDLDPTTGRSEVLLPGTGPLPFGEVSHPTPHVSAGLTRVDGGRPSLPVPSTALQPLEPGDQVSYHYDDRTGNRTFQADTVLPRARRRRGSITYTVLDSTGNTAILSNDEQGLRLHAAKVKLASGRRVPMAFLPPMVLLPPAVGTGPHASEGRVRVRRSNGRVASIRYHLQTRFQVACCAGDPVLTDVTGPAPHMLGIIASNVLDFSGSRRGIPLALSTRSQETYARDFGIVSSSIRFTDRGTRVIGRRDGAGGSANADRTADVVGIAADSGSIGIWAMQGVNQPGWTLLTGGDDTVADVVATGDLDGDGQLDAVVHDEESGLATLVPGTPGVASLPLAFIPAGVEIIDVGDFTRDGRRDILWHDRNSGALGVWTRDGSTLIPAALIRDEAGQPLNLVDGQRIEAIADVNGDGNGDVLLHDQATGRHLLWLMQGTRRTAENRLGRIGRNWHLAAVDDMNGDGRADLILRHVRGRATRLWLMNGPRRSARGIRPAPRGHVLAGSGDYDGDGYVDLLWRNETTHELSVWLMRSTRVLGRANLGSLPPGFAPF